MNNSGKTYSKAAVAGFILAVAPVAVFLLIEFADLFIHIHSGGFNRIYAYSIIVCGILSVLIGIVLSIAGLISCARKDLKGKGFAIAAIVLFVLEAMIYIIALAIAINTYLVVA